MKTNNNLSRTICKYGNCSLEKLEIEIIELNKIWISLEENWDIPKDREDLYRIYPLLDTTAALARKMLCWCGKKNKQYKVDIIKPSNDRIVDTSQYLYSQEYKFFNGINDKILLADIVSQFLHANEYVYIDDRKELHATPKTYEIYVYIKTDQLCDSCAEANLKNPQKDKVNYRNSIGFVRYDDCTCGSYINVRSYINSLLLLLENTTKSKK